MGRRTTGRWAALTAAVLVLAGASSALAATPPAPKRIIEMVSGDIWRAGNGNWWAMSYVTPAGIILADPINPEFAAWLKAELDTRFPKLPVRYVIYSHSHWDHIEGGRAFAATAQFVAQEGVAKNMDGRYPHMPGDMLDRNQNGTIEQEEIDGPSNAHPGICGMGPNFVASHDRNGDGHLTPAELYADVPHPDITYSRRMEITLGGRTVQLIFPGKNHADDGTVIYFPAERVVFSTDFPADALVGKSMRSLPSACGAFDEHPIADWIASYRTIEALDFDILAQGHGSVNFTKADVTEGREYFEYLRDQVLAAMRAGKSLDEMRKTILLDKYKDWAFYDRLRVMNIEAAYNNLKTYK